MQSYTFAGHFKEKWQNTLRGGAVVARRAHNPKVVGSNPAPATSKTQAWPTGRAFLFQDMRQASLRPIAQGANVRELK